MINFKRILKVGILSLLGFFTVVTHSIAGSNESAADFLVEVGVRDYERGDVDSAIHEFSKALILNPNHVEAKKNLQALGMSEGLYKPARTSHSQVQELNHNLAAYEQQLVKLEHQNDIMNGMFDQLQAERNNLYAENQRKYAQMKVIKQEMDLMERSLNEQNKAHQKQIDQMDDMYSSMVLDAKEDVWAQAQGVFAQKPVHDMDAHQLALHQRDEEIFALRERLDESVSQAIDYERQLKSLDEKYDELVQYVHPKYAHQDKLIHVLEDYLRLREMHLNDTQDELVNKEVDLTRHINDLMYKIDELIELYEIVK